MGMNLVFVVVVILFQKSVGVNLASTYLDYFEGVFFHTNLSGVSEKCRRLFIGGNFSRTIFFDACGKIPDGINNGNFFELGNFDQCYHHFETIGDDIHTGKYCLGFMGLGESKDFPTIRLNFVKNNTFGMYTGFCLSNHCTLKDFSKIFYKHHFSEEQCYSKNTEKKISVGGWITISIISAFIAITICSTFYDILIAHTGKEPLHPSLLIFSAVRNGKKILATSNNPQQILCLNGIRSLSMAWIICHHEFLLSMLGPVGNFYEVIQTYYSPTTMFLHQTPLSVDSFLTLAGILTAYTLMKRKKINVIENYVHRYFRLTPVIGMVILMLATLYTNIGEGPFWAETSRVSNSCRDNWWTFFFYIENYIPAESCIPQGWYLGVDMQCYIVAVIIMVFLKKWSKMTLIGMGVLILLSTVVSFWNCYINRWAVVRVHFTAKADDYNFHYYIKTYTRCGPYLIGMICGYIIYNLKTSPRKYQLTMGKKFLYWMTCLTLLATCIYLPLSLTDDDDSIWQNALFIPVHRLVWSACVCSIVLMCVTDNADFVNSFLSMPIFQVVARLSYCAYIVHNFWILAKVISLKTVVNYYVHQVVVDSWGTTAVSLLLSFILSLMFEMPAPEIEKYCIKFVKKIFAVLSSAMGIKSKAPNTL